jgi:predicted Fe-Mo cluster-binding NifX family protein
VIITGGMGMHAQRLFEQYGIQVQIGAKPGKPEDVAKAWLAGNLDIGANPCDH